jgi:HSP20 family molecular chaperone IbpA
MTDQVKNMKPQKTMDRSKEELEFQLSLLQKRANSPKVDLVESESFFTIRMEMPGVNSHSIKVELKESNILLVSGFKQEVLYEGKAKYKECKYGNFMRRVKMPVHVDYSNQFTYTDGVFTLKLTKTTVPPVQPSSVGSANWADI